VSQADAVVNSMADLVLRESLEPGSVVPIGNRVEDGIRCGVYPCADDDGWCAIVVRDDRDWAALCEVVGALDEDTFDERVTAWTTKLDAREVMHRLQAIGVPAATVVTPFDLLADPHLHAHGFVEVIEQPGWEPLFVEGPCFRSERLHPAPPTPAPRHGADTRDLAADVLGLGSATIDALVAAGVLEVPGDEPPEAGPAL
jgi:crotonobetainyl-CoA:carnitine CoA-transferase CaiB-like acyl-CoA transferase